MTLNQATWHWKNPLKSVRGKKCRICGKDATCAVLTTAVYPACEDHARAAKLKGYDVVFPESKGSE